MPKASALYYYAAQFMGRKTPHFGASGLCQVSCADVPRQPHDMTPQTTKNQAQDLQSLAVCQLKDQGFSPARLNAVGAGPPALCAAGPSPFVLCRREDPATGTRTRAATPSPWRGPSACPHPAPVGRTLAPAAPVVAKTPDHNQNPDIPQELTPNRLTSASHAGESGE